MRGARPATAVLAIASTLLVPSCASFGTAEPAPDAGPTADAAPAPPADGGTAEADASHAPECTGALLLDEAFAGTGSQFANWFSDGTPTRDPSGGLPAPSLVSTTPAKVDGRTTHRLLRTLTSVPARLCIELDLFLDADPTTYASNAFTEAFALFPAGRRQVFIEIHPDGLNLVADQPYVRLERFAFRRWHHLTIRLDYEAQAPTIVVAVDGVEDASGGAGARGAPSDLEVAVGLMTEGRAGAVTMRADNLRITSP